MRPIDYYNRARAAERYNERVWNWAIEKQRLKDAAARLRNNECATCGQSLSPVPTFKPGDMVEDVLLRIKARVGIVVSRTVSDSLRLKYPYMVGMDLADGRTVYVIWVGGSGEVLAYRPNALRLVHGYIHVDRTRDQTRE